MSKNITIIDNQYKEWIADLSKRYRQSQVKAAVKVNTEMLRFYWSLGRDIVALNAEASWGSKFMKNLSSDLKALMPEATCFSETNLKYMKYFYEMYCPFVEIAPQDIEGNENTVSPQLEDKMPITISPQLGDKISEDIFSTPWGHHKLLIDVVACNHILKQPHHNPTSASWYARARTISSPNTPSKVATNPSESPSTNWRNSIRQRSKA